MASQSFDPNFDPYGVLGLNAGASPEVVRAAYRALARKHHPDNGAEPDAERMVRINRAHEILSDPARRRAWNAETQRRRDAEAQRQRAQTGPRPGSAQRQRAQAGSQQQRTQARGQTPPDWLVQTPDWLVLVVVIVVAFLIGVNADDIVQWIVAFTR